MNIVNTSFIKKGDIIQFGHFPQSQSDETEFHAVGNNVYLDNKENKVYKQFCKNFVSKEDKYFNLEPILWEVVEVNQNYYRLLSLKMLIYSRLGDDDHNNCTYSNSDLRKYLNRDFYNLAFSSEEQQMILKTSLAGENSIPQISANTSSINCDSVFLPSLTELNNIGAFRLTKDKTVYAESNVYCGNLNSWLTRTPGTPEELGFRVYNTVKMIAQSYSGNGFQVRQAAVNDPTGVAPEIIIQIPNYAKMEQLVTSVDKKSALIDLVKNEQWKQDKRCTYCGGSFKGLLRKKCSSCGRMKDY